MEHPKHHEVIRPIREIVQGLGNFVLDKILPTDVISDVFNGVQQESAQRTAQTFDFSDRTVPSVDGRDL